MDCEELPWKNSLNKIIRDVFTKVFKLASQNARNTWDIKSCLFTTLLTFNHIRSFVFLIGFHPASNEQRGQSFRKTHMDGCTQKKDQFKSGLQRFQ